jgi:hypothetical protein
MAVWRAGAHPSPDDDSVRSRTSLRDTPSPRLGQGTFIYGKKESTLFGTLHSQFAHFGTPMFVDGLTPGAAAATCGSQTGTARSYPALAAQALREI